jgi:hypothetical protein
MNDPKKGRGIFLLPFASKARQRTVMMPETLKAIETVYRGYRFRSRLEARWAVFFDALHISYEYEKEGYDLDGLWYLPDFWLSRLELFVEIKPGGQWFYHRECDLLARSSGKDVLFLSGNPYPGEYGAGVYKHQWHSGSEPGEIAVCRRCPGLSLLRQTADDEWFANMGKHTCSDDNERWPLGVASSPGLLSAYTAARQARFEHGESPRI